MSSTYSFSRQQYTLDEQTACLQAVHPLGTKVFRRNIRNFQQTLTSVY